MTKMKVGDEIEVDGEVYVVALNTGFVLIGEGWCHGCEWFYDETLCTGMGYIRDEKTCSLPKHLIFKLKGDVDVQV